MDLSVGETAALLGVHRSRVEQLLWSGQLRGRRAGRLWFIDAQSVYEVRSRSRAPGRPLAPGRAWGLLDLLEGGGAPWLSSVARSQVRARLRGLGDADADRWRALLRGRSQRLPVRVHPGALAALLGEEAVLPAGLARAACAGADLVVIDPLPEIYVRVEEWPALAERWHPQPAPGAENLRVHLPRTVWPFAGRDEVGPAALAADLLDSAEPRAISAGETLLRELLAGAGIGP